MITSRHNDARRIQPSAAFAASSAPCDRILNWLRDDHGAALSYAALLRREMSASRLDHKLIGSLINKLADAPDDIHHVIEHKLFRQLRRRLGTPLKRRLDLDTLHEERRESRFAMLEARRDANGVIAGDARERRSVLAFCDCVERHARIEERLLLPFARRFLPNEDWAETVEAFDLYNDVLSAIRRQTASSAECAPKESPMPASLQKGGDFTRQ